MTGLRVQRLRSLEIDNRPYIVEGGGWGGGVAMHKVMHEVEQNRVLK